jgi:hypothetical protein
MVLRRLDVEQLVEQSSVDYLAVTSAPPRTAAPGGTLRYPLQVLSKRGGLRYAVDIGPPGMTVTPQGEVVWKVPAKNASHEQRVVLSIRDASDQERLQSFTLQLAEAETPAEGTRGMREWTDSTGRNRIRAELLEVLPGKVRLKKENGAVIEVPIKLLSRGDQDYIRGKK